VRIGVRVLDGLDGRRCVRNLFLAPIFLTPHHGPLVLRPFFCAFACSFFLTPFFLSVTFAPFVTFAVVPSFTVFMRLGVRITGISSFFAPFVIPSLFFACPAISTHIVLTARV
jgi:hypothetical protein